MFRVRINYKSGASDLLECPEAEAREAVSRASLKMAAGEVINVIAWEI
jgi:hypothetical protein